MGSSDKPMDEQLQELWEKQGEKIGVPQGVCDLLDLAPAHKRARETQERMHALITQHGSVLAALTALWQHLEAQQNDEQTDSLENLVPHIDVPTYFNQGMSEFAHEHHNRLQRERRAKQREQLSLRNDTLQLFGDKDASALGRWDCGKMDTICGFCSAKMWIKEQLAKSRNNNP